MNKKFLQSLLIVLFFLFALPTFSAPQYSNFYFFGDSLSDIGNGPLNHGCLTNRDGNTNECLTWANDLYFNIFGSYALPSNQGGTDYAVGSAVSADLNAQVAQYLKDHHNQVDPNAYYFFLIGANDIMNMVNSTGESVQKEAATGGLFPAITKTATTVGDYNNNLEATTTSNGTGIITNEMNVIKTLYDAGAQHIMIINLPDMSSTPQVQTGINNLMASCQKSILVPKADKSTCLAVGQGIFGLVDTFVRDFNGTLARWITLEKFDPQRVKLFSMYDASQQVIRSGELNPNGTCSGTAQECASYVFFNGVHPGAAAHKIMAEEMLQTL